LFSRPDAFIEAGITHPDVRAAPRVRDRALLHGGQPMPALQVWRLHEYSNKDVACADIEQASVAWIGAMLDDPTVQLRDGDGKQERLQPKHIAVLVNSNAEAASMQAALGRAGVPACSNLRASVYASNEAGDLGLLLDALVAPDDARRARAAQASMLIGDDAVAIAAGIADTDAQAVLLERIASWSDEVQRHGPLPWLHALIARAAPRLLALPDGERRVANYLQLAELLQPLHAQSFGLDDLAVRFARTRIEAADDADAARLRLDTDADAVTVSTVHAAKGLEYAVVLVPYAVLGKNPAKSRGALPLHWYHAADNIPRVAIGAGTGEAAAERAIAEIRAEEIRKFYVAVTRAKALCVLPYGPASGVGFSAVLHLLQRAGREGLEQLAVDTAGCDQALDELHQRANGAVDIIELPDLAAPRRGAVNDATVNLHARSCTRATLERDWQTWSFSRLVRGNAPHDAADPAPGSGDTDPAGETGRTEAGIPQLGGARFGNAVHAVFEHTDFAAWRGAADVPDSERGLVGRSLRQQGLAGSEVMLRHAATVVRDCIHAALNTTLPCGTRLCDVAPAQRKAEIEFHLTLREARSSELYALLHRHGYQRQRSGVAPQRLHGLMTGKIDLTFMHAGRFHIVDWKTNRCAPFDHAALAAEISAHDYDLQWLVYTLALHRWLRQQIPGYDYDAHVGDVYYLFVRGMAQAGCGVHADRPPRELIEAMDALFDERAEGDA
jgi:exodeoxyribonuclease V beta subunit